MVKALAALVLAVLLLGGCIGEDSSPAGGQGSPTTTISRSRLDPWTVKSLVGRWQSTKMVIGANQIPVSPETAVVVVFHNDSTADETIATHKITGSYGWLNHTAVAFKKDKAVSIYLFMNGELSTITEEGGAQVKTVYKKSA